MMAKRDNISMSVIKRLPRYYRYLSEMKCSDIERISSRELSQRTGLTASQIRQDLNCFGGFGQQGYGYNIDQLHKEIGDILGLNVKKKIIIIGAGNLGRALVAHVDFEERGFNLIGLFDKNEAMAGQMVGLFPVRHVSGLDEFCHENRPQIATLCIPRAAAQEMVDQLINLGIIGFWNFSHYDMAVKYSDIPVENVHLGDILMRLSYRTTKHEG